MFLRSVNNQGDEMAKNQEKVNLSEIISVTVEKFVEIMNEDIKQNRKTQKEKRLAEGCKKALLEGDKRSNPTPVTLFTANKYLSKIRSAISDLGYKHHALAKVVKKLSKQYPEHKTMLDKLETLPLREAADLKKTTIDKLFELRKNENDATNKKLISDQYNELSAIKLAPAFMSYLAFNNDDKREIKDQKDKTIKEKKTHKIVINMSKVTNLIADLLSTSVSDPKRAEKLALGVALATGRRQIEVCVQGNFNKAEEYKIKFSGIAKSRGSDREVVIPSLAPVDAVLEALEYVRNSELMEKIKGSMTEQSIYSANEMFNNKNRGLTIQASKIFNDAFGVKPDSSVWTFKDSRAIYAKTAYEMYKKDSESKNEKTRIDEDIFLTEKLGHNDKDAKDSYKAFEIIPDDITKADPSKLVERTPEQRLDGLKELLNNSAIQQNRLEKNLERVIEFVEKTPEQQITKIWLRKEVKGGKTIRLNMLQEIIAKAGLDLV